MPWAEFWYNTTFHVSIGTTPFEIVYGRKPPTPLQYILGEIKVEWVARELADCKEVLAQLKFNLLKAQNAMTKEANKHRRDVTFEPGSWVYLKLVPHKQQSVARRINQKLAARFYGPFQIKRRNGSVAYELKIPDTSRVHPVFHASMPKKAHKAPLEAPELPEGFEVELAEAISPVKVLSFRKVTRGDEEINQCLIQWKDGRAEDASWEDELTIRAQFPQFSFEDKTVGPAGVNDKNEPSHEPSPVLKPRVWKVYERKNKRKT